MPFKLEFLLCGSPNDAFYSQAAMFRLGLDALGAMYRQARLVLCLDHGAGSPPPVRWREHLARVELHYAPLDHFIGEGDARIEYGDSRLHSYTLIDPGADLSFVCDADTLLLKAYSNAFLKSLAEEGAVAGVIAHRPPEKKDMHGRDYGALPNGAFWNALAQHVLGRTVACPHRYALAATDQQCPFYINYGLVAGRPELLARLHASLLEVQPRVREFLDNVYYSQLAVALAVEHAGLRTRALPLRYNYPNWRDADALYPDELGDIHLLHFQSRELFDRHRIFVNQEQFGQFMSLQLTGSDAIFQARVRELTGGNYPFDQPPGTA
jgi:hypothetical protein